MTFLRQIALLLPSAFLLGVLLFLLTHGRGDPALATYPFLEAWLGPPGTGRGTPEVRFLIQTALFFLPAYLAALLLVFGVTLAERAVFGRSASASASGYRSSFAAAFSVLFLGVTGALVFWGNAVASRKAPGALVAPLVVGLAPFAAGAVAVLPAAVLAGPIAALRKAGRA